ncbi:hypothetical protein [Wielerella bovis]|nr:hypothetical protein [Wielerella bovis]
MPDAFPHFDYFVFSGINADLHMMNNQQTMPFEKPFRQPEKS